ncbi:MAG: HEAT repeat domain-containing protein, partial [Desulfuromonadaceae bacterium]|nr:HEAT repeat domain-containing protein [Desulfuromonadaceae bacterium]
RITDKRWYFQRNLLIILTAINDPAVVPNIRPLLRTNEHRLRLQVMRTLVHFRDPQAEKMIINDLDSPNPDIQTTAIQLAERCTAPAITLKLIGMLSQGGYSQFECEKKCLIVRTLGEIGRVEVLPGLATILSTWSLLHSQQLTKLKVEIIRSLPKYPTTVSRPILERIANGSGEIAHLAAESLRTLSGKST